MTTPTIADQIEVGVRRRRRLILFGVLGWVPMFLLVWALTGILSEQSANLIAMTFWGITGAFALLQYTSWRCPGCGQFFACSPKVGYTPNNLWILGRTCRSCGLKI